MSFQLLDDQERNSNSPYSPESRPRSLFIDSVNRFSIISPNFVDSTEDAVRGLFYCDSMISISAAVYKNDRSFSEYRNEERNKLNQQLNITLDTVLDLNGDNAILWESAMSLPGRGDFKFIRLDILAKSNAYSLCAYCPQADYLSHATALRNALMSFKRF
jgi:hypothetical protein